MTEVLIALGSNRPHGRHGSPAQVVQAAIAALAGAGVRPARVSKIHATKAIGSGGRDFANAVILANTNLYPPELLTLLKSIERTFGRRRGRAWGARVLDLDILACGGTVWPSRLGWQQARCLAVPHRALAGRRFVLDPLLDIAPAWRHPILGLTARQLHARLTARRPAPSPAPVRAHSSVG